MTYSRAGLPADARGETARVRQGQTLGVMRWVLTVSLAITAIALGIAFLITPIG